MISTRSFKLSRSLSSWRHNSSRIFDDTATFNRSFQYLKRMLFATAHTHTFSVVTPIPEEEKKKKRIKSAHRNI